MKILVLILVLVILLSGCTDTETIIKEVSVCNDRAVIDAEEFLQCQDWCQLKEEIVDEAELRGEIESWNFECNYEVSRGSCCLDSFIEYDNGDLRDRIPQGEIQKIEYWRQFGHSCMN